MHISAPSLPSEIPITLVISTVTSTHILLQTPLQLSTIPSHSSEPFEFQQTQPNPAARIPNARRGKKNARSAAVNYWNTERACTRPSTRCLSSRPMTRYVTSGPRSGSRCTYLWPCSRWSLSHVSPMDKERVLLGPFFPSHMRRRWRRVNVNKYARETRRCSALCPADLSHSANLYRIGRASEKNGNQGHMPRRLVGRCVSLIFSLLAAVFFLFSGGRPGWHWLFGLCVSPGGERMENAERRRCELFWKIKFCGLAVMRLWERESGALGEVERVFVSMLVLDFTAFVYWLFAFDYAGRWKWILLGFDINFKS